MFKIVGDHDCVLSIAKKNGLTIDKIWDHQKNLSLRNTRKDLNILFSGDQLFVPEIEPKDYSVPVNERHRYVRKGLMARVRLRLLMADKPIADQAFIWTCAHYQTDGQTDADGNLEVGIVPDATVGRLQLKDPEDAQAFCFKVLLGRLDPMDEVIGVQQRLRNLGVPCDLSGVWDDTTAKALKGFQAKNDLRPTGIFDAVTKSKLLDTHGM